MSTTAVLEIEPLGHRLRYVRHLFDAAAAADGDCLILLSATARDAPEFATHLGGLEDSVVVVDGAGWAGVLPGAVALAARRGVRRLVVPEADKALTPLLRLALQRRLPLEVRALMLRAVLPGGSERATVGMALKPAVVAALRAFPQVRLFFLTDALGVVRRRRGFPGVRPVADPVRPVVASGARPAWFPTGTTVGMLGVTSARKNLPLLVEALRERPAVSAVVAGRVEPDVRAWLADDPDARALAAAGRLVVADRVLDDAEYDAALGALDAVAVLHDNDAPSGVLAEACALGVPVLAPDRGWLARVVDATGVGRTTALDARSIGLALDALLAGRAGHVAAGARVRDRLGVGDFTTALLG